MKQQWEMCTLERRTRLNEQEKEIVKAGLAAGVIEVLRLGESFYAPKFFAPATNLYKEFSDLDEGIEFLLRDGWEPFSIIAKTDNDHENDVNYYFRRKVE